MFRLTCARTVRAVAGSRPALGRVMVPSMAATNSSVEFPMLSSFRFMTTSAKSSDEKPESTAASTEEQTEAEKEQDLKSRYLAKVNFDEYDDYEFNEANETKGERVKRYFISFAHLSLYSLIAYLTYLTAKELFPGRMHAQSLFNEAAAHLQFKEELLSICGADIRSFGRDNGGAGRRNHIDSFTYTGDDGSQRLRIRFNMSGTTGKVRVWAEVSDRMGPGEYVYLIVQNMKNGRVITFVDKRDELAAGMTINSSTPAFLKDLFNSK